MSSSAGNLKRGGWPKGQSGNPSGKASVAKALRDAGFDPESLRKEVVQKVVDGFRTLHAGDKDEGASWRWCMERAWILVSLPAKPAETPESTLTDEEYQEELDLIAKERIAKMTPEERFKLLSNTAPSDSVQ